MKNSALLRTALLTLMGLAGFGTGLAQPPTAPAIALNGTHFEYGDNISIGWNLWWGTQGSSWQLLDGSELLCSKDIDVVSSFPQTDSCTVDLTAGSHQLRVILINEEGATASAAVSVTVDHDAGGPATGLGHYEVTSHWPGGQIIAISFAENTAWEAHVTYTAAVNANVWTGTATVDGLKVIYQPSQYGFRVAGQLDGDGYAIPEQSYILAGGEQIPFSSMPVPPATNLDTYYLDEASYLATPRLDLGQLTLANVWDSGPFSMMIPNERKYWAMAAAHAGQLFRNVTGIDDPFTDGNHYLATAIQESRMGADPASDTFTYPHVANWPITYQPAADSDGFQQIEGSSGGSAYADLQRLYPNRYGNLSHAETVSGDRFCSATLTAAYYNIFMYQFLEGAGYRPADFFSRAQDPQALDRVMALVYNRGAYSTHVSKVFIQQRDYCIGLNNMADEAGNCLPNTGDFGSKYVRQVPGYNRDLKLAAEGVSGAYPGRYEVEITWDDISTYLNRIAVLYSQEDMQAARSAAQTAFDQARGTETSIDYSSQFGAVLDGIMLALPVDSAANQLCKVFAKCAVED